MELTVIKRIKDNSPTDSTGRLNIKGPVIPLSWWHCIRTPKGKIDPVAVALLSYLINKYPVEGKTQEWIPLQSSEISKEFLGYGNEDIEHGSAFVPSIIPRALKNLKRLNLIHLRKMKHPCHQKIYYMVRLECGNILAISDYKERKFFM